MISSMATTLTLGSLYQQVEKELDTVRSNVRQHWTEAFQLVYGPSATPPRLGGKMMRPALCLLSSGAAGAPDPGRFVEMATAMELLHLAALAHDDVVDSALLRRGSSSLNALWDNHTAVLGGDYLVARALTVLTHYDSCPVIASALESIHEMAEGELINFGRGRQHLDEDDCMLLARKKTASLFAVACSTPALLIDEAYCGPLHEFGMGMGTAFQLVDDLLDLEGDEATLGKPACGDLAEAKVTLPILFMRETMDEGDLRRLEGMTGETPIEDDKRWVAGMVRFTGAGDRTAVLARKCIDEALAALERLPQSTYTEAMAGVAEFGVVRDC